MVTAKADTTTQQSLQPNAIIRRRLQVQGAVQGVGFRPFVYGLARNLGLVGFVGNNGQGVFIEVEGTSSTLETFQETLMARTPPLAHIEAVTVQLMCPEGSTDFVIVRSQPQAEDNTLISPDQVTCSDCLREFFDPADRRYHYPFINCTNCGPRFTIIRDIPYDRPLTTMADFPMCPQCQAEYDDPSDRRFHAQPNACPTCGPQVEFRWSDKSTWLGLRRNLDLSFLGEDAVSRARGLIAQGGIVSVKGLGGFHLACDATSDRAVLTLRHRKGRVDKAFAVMAVNLSSVRQFAEINPQEQTLLTSRERPIVLLKKRANGPLSEFIAPGNQYIGVMLPYTPLHHLLLSPDKLSEVNGPQSNVLVMTSGNYSDEPIVKDNNEALQQLATLADAFLLHNRNIYARCDDSVIRIFDGNELPLRRSRGYAPFPVKLPFDVPPVLAVGGELKSTFCLTKGNHAFLSQHIGDMENLETMQAFEESVNHFKALFRAKPNVVAADMHPGYLSSRWATENAQGLKLVKVQHHHAHLAAVMAEHGLDGREPVIGFSFDGTGYGPDGAIWGGELLIANYKGFTRMAHLKYLPLPGGDAAVKRPYRAALAQLWAANVAWGEDLPPVAACTAAERNVIKHQLETGLNAVPTSSMGRLFDAVASLVGLRQTVTYEGQAAIELESIAADGTMDSYLFALSEAVVRPPGDSWDDEIEDSSRAGEALGPAPYPTGYHSLFEIEAAPIIRAVVADLRAGLPSPIMAAKFHNAVAEVVVRLSARLRTVHGLNQVALSGGVFQNVTLLKLAVDRLRSADFEVLTHRLVPPNDGGLALGQAIISSQKNNGG